MTVKVALGGATGNVGIPILNALLAANYSVTVLSRANSNNTSKLPQSPKLKIVEVDFASFDSLKAALEGHQVVISAVATVSVVGQRTFIDAAIAAGVTRFIPSEFGSDTVHPKASQLPVFKYKVATQEYLKDKVAEHPGFSYTIVNNGAFFDWGIERGWLLNVKTHKVTVWDGGDRPFSASSLATVGRAVVGVIEHLDETANRPVYIHDAAVTQNQLLEYVREKDGQDWQITHKDTQKVYQESHAALRKDPDLSVSVMGGFVMSAIFAEGYGGDFSDHLDNELLGLKQMTEEDVKEFLWSIVASSSKV